MSKARLKQMLLQTDMFLEHQYNTGWAKGGEKHHKLRQGDKVQGNTKKYILVQNNAKLMQEMQTFLHVL